MGRPGKFDAHKDRARRLWQEGFSLTKILNIFKSDGIIVPKPTVQSWIKAFARENPPNMKSGMKAADNSIPDFIPNSESIDAEAVERFRNQLNAIDPEPNLVRVERRLFQIADSERVSAAVQIQALNALAKISMWREDKETAAKVVDDDGDEFDTVLIEVAGAEAVAQD